MEGGRERERIPTLTTATVSTAYKRHRRELISHLYTNVRVFVKDALDYLTLRSIISEP